jgi:hypothetical protein
MNRYIFAGAALLAVIFAAISLFSPSKAVAQEYAGFYGTITYSQCECTEEAYADKVVIKEIPDGDPVVCGITCDGDYGTYDTESNCAVFPPGNYQLYLQFDDPNSECVIGSVVQVTHGYTSQKVDLTAYGSGGGGSR